MDPSGSRMGELHSCKCSLKGFSMSFKSFQFFLEFTRDIKTKTKKVHCLIIWNSATAKKRVKQCANLSEGSLGRAAKLPV